MLDKIKEGTQLHYCYLLLSDKKKKASYIGYSINPCRRLRQHNGEIKKGAKKTKDGIPWYFGICIGGFPNRIAALRFEWAWQHPNVCCATRDHIKLWKIIKSSNSSNKKSILSRKQWSIQQRISVLICMITIEPWKNMNLNIFIFKDIVEDIIIKVIDNLDKYKLSNNFSRPNILNNDCLMFLYNGNDIDFQNGTKFFKCDYETFKNIHKNTLDYDSDVFIEDNSFIFIPNEFKNIYCSLCQNHIIENKKYIEFPCCNNIFAHIYCIYSWGEISKKFNDINLNNIYNELLPPLVPNTISCPCCFQFYKWDQIKNNHLKIAHNSLIDDLEQDNLKNNLKKQKTNPNFNENIQPEILNKNHDSIIPYINKDNSFFDEEFSEISQKCEFIDLTVDSD